MKVVLAIDASPLTNVTVDEIVARPWPKGTVVTVLHVVDLFNIPSGVAFIEYLAKQEADAARTLGTSIVGQLGSKGIEAATHVVEGYPSTEIVDYARQIASDLIIVGAQGHSGIARFLLGSVAKAVARNAHCSVEIVRPSVREPGAEPHGPGPMRLLLAADGSDYSASAARSIVERPWPKGSEIRILSVVDLPIPAADPWCAAGEVIERLRKDRTEAARDAVVAAKRIVGDSGLRCSEVVLTGSPKWTVVDEAKEWGANLIVVGSHGRRGVTRLVLGSVSEAVALQAHCSVDIIRDAALLGND